MKAWIPFRCYFAERDKVEDYCGFNGEGWDGSEDECHHTVPKEFVMYLEDLEAR